MTLKIRAMACLSSTLLLSYAVFANTNHVAINADCRTATAPALYIACKNSQILKMDKRMEQLFYKKRAELSQKDRRLFYALQKDWTRRIIRCNQNISCIRNNYSMQISWLRSLPYADNFGANIHSGPGFHYPVIGKSSEIKIKVIDVTQVREKGFLWFKIKTKKQEGYQWGGSLCDPLRESLSACGP